MLKMNRRKFCEIETEKQKPVPKKGNLKMTNGYTNVKKNPALLPKPYNIWHDQHDDKHGAIYIPTHWRKCGK